MTRSDLIARLTLADRGLTADEIDRSVDSFFGLLQNRLKVEDAVTVFGLVRHLQLRSTHDRDRHPAAMTEVDVAASLIPAKPSDSLLS